jgi:hypothetical protein
MAMRQSIIMSALGLWCALPALGHAEPLPFQHKVEVYRAKKAGPKVFALRLEQPFLAEEFEKSNYLHLEALDRNAYLIYPKQTKFQQKHAEFYGRLRGQGKAKLRLSYEIVSETLDGSRKVTVRHTNLEVAIPAEPGGPESIYHAWADQQNAYFLDLLSYYPQETFFQYCLLQSKERYGVTPPKLDKPERNESEVEASLYDALTGSLAIQEALQREVLSGKSRVGDLNIHISELKPPPLQSLPYGKLLEEKKAKNILPRVQPITRLIPEDQYFLHFNSMQSAGELFDLVNDWGNSLFRLFSIRAQDNRLQAKMDEQLCLRRGPLTRLFADGVVTEMAITGGDSFVLEGTDVTIVFRLKRPEVFRKLAEEWLAEAKKKHSNLVEREFNYRGHKVAARYTPDRQVSSFVVQHDPYLIYSNSHRAIRNLVDAATGKARRLYDALDYRYATTLLPPNDAANAGYFFASESCLKRLISPEGKIAEKRRLQCFNNLVMLNNASLFYRLEHGSAPTSLSALVEGRFVDAAKVVCPHGGVYALDAKNDTCTCSMHNRLKYLTPNAELTVLKVSRSEREEYERYKQSYLRFWQNAFDPIALRITMARRVKLELCVLPFANGSLYNDLRRWVAAKPQAFDTQRIARSAVVSLMAVRGRQALGDFLRGLPGVPEALQADPTLTDLGWLGDRIALHYCDGETILEIDPTRLRQLDLAFVGKTSIWQQALLGAALTATEVPTYISIDVQDPAKAARLLKQLSQKIPLQKGELLTLSTTQDAYRLPDYKKHAHYVFSYRLYALKVRLHVALVGNQLVAATKAHVLREVIDAASAPQAKDPPMAHLLFRLNARALNRLHDNMNLSWSEKSRLACHRNTISIYNLVKLYEVPIKAVPRLAEAKYGVRYFCPEHGVYEYDAGRDQVLCSVHGNRQASRQNPRLDKESSFVQFIEGLDEVVAGLRFQEDALRITVEIGRRQPVEK